MGVIDTVIKYNRKEAEDRGKLIIKLTEKINFLNNLRTRKFTNEDLATMINVELSFVKDFKKSYTKEKFDKLIKIIDQSGKLEELGKLADLKQFLIKKMADFGFSKLALVEYFKMKNKVIEEIIKEK